MSPLDISESYTPAVVIIPQVGDSSSALFKRIHAQEEIRDILAYQAQQDSHMYDLGWGEWF